MQASNQGILRSAERWAPPWHRAARCEQDEGFTGAEGFFVITAPFVEGGEPLVGMAADEAFGDARLVEEDGPLGVAALLRPCGFFVALHRGLEAAQRVVLRTDPLRLGASRPKSGEGSPADRGSWPKMLRNRLKTKESTSSRERVLSIAVWGCRVAGDICFNLPSLESRERRWPTSSPDTSRSGARGGRAGHRTGAGWLFDGDHRRAPGLGGRSWRPLVAEQLTFYEERVSGAEYSPVDNRLLFGMDAGGNERTQLFLLERGEVTDLTRAPDAIHYSGGFSPTEGA